MRIVFAGTPPFAARALEALFAAGHQVPLVLTQPDRHAGRGMTLKTGAVKQVALSHDVKVWQPATLKDPATEAKLRATDAEVMVVAAYGLLLPQAVLDIPQRGCLNIHASLLPRWRGAAPIQRAIEAGDGETGITIMRMEAGLDTGPMLLQSTLPIAVDDTAGTLHDKLATLGAASIIAALTRVDALTPEPQPTTGVTYAHKIEKAEALVNWQQNALLLSRKVRAFNPFPGMTASLRGTSIKLWGATPIDASGIAGTVLAADMNGVIVAAGKGALRITHLQKSGSKCLPAKEFLRGFSIAVGQAFD